MLNSGRPIYENKKTPEGMNKRIELLSSCYDGTKDIIAYAHNTPKLKSMLDDVIDALCLAVTGIVGLEKWL